MFCRAMLCKRGPWRHAVSVRPSVCLPRSWILSKRINISLKKISQPGSQTILVFPYQTSWKYRAYFDGDPPPLTGVSNAGGVGTNRDSGRIDRWLLDVRATATDDRAVYCTDDDASVNLRLSQPATSKTMWSSPHGGVASSHQIWCK